MRSARSVLAALVAAGLAAGVGAQEAATAPGLILGFATAAGAEDARLARMVALSVGEGEAPTPFLAPGPFTATWRGGLEVAFRDRYTFSFEGTGVLALRIGGREVELGKPRRLKRGVHAIEVRYTSPAGGPARLRLSWSASDFAAEPLPPRRLSHDPADPVLRAGLLWRRGRAVIAERHCTRCHHPDEAVVSAAGGGMPELAASGPVLAGVGARLRQRWLQRWILDPRQLRPDATMPALLDGPSAADDVRDIAVYLAGTAAPARDAAAAPPEVVAAGGVLFAQLGCVGCHALPDREVPADRVSLRHVGAKYQPGALAAFLQQPDRHYPWIAMPDFALGAAEARALAAFLRDRSESEVAELAGTRAADPQRGRTLVTTLGCLKCHFMAELGVHPAPDWRTLRSWDRGCLAADETGRGEAPRLGLAAADRDAVRAVAADLTHLRRDVAAEFAARRREALRCNACHARDGVQDLWSVRVAEVEELLAGVEAPHLAQRRPTLTWAGEKLRVDWATALLRGAHELRPRPWLRARMPAFRAGAALMAAGLAAEHGLAPQEARTVPDAALVPIGRKLIGADGGFACTLCHGLGEQGPTGVFEVQGIHFGQAAARLRHDFYLRWLRDPLRIDPSSRMPKYSTPAGRTAFTDILEGDAVAQFEAMWHFLCTQLDDR